MTRRLGLLVLLVAVSTLLALPAGARVSPRRDVDEPNLDEAYYQIEDAEGHEDDAYDALSESFDYSGFAAGELDYSAGHLEDALAAIKAAESSGEMAPDLAQKAQDELNAAIAADHRAATDLEFDDFAKARDDFDGAEAAKEIVEDLINGYSLDSSVSLGCKLFLDSNPFPGDTAVGLDGCTLPLSRIAVIDGYQITRHTNITIGSGQFPCVEPLTWRLICDDPVQPGQPAFLAFNSSPDMTLNQIVAFAADGRQQVLPFTIGTAMPFADTGATASLSWVTSRGFKSANKLELGSMYAFRSYTMNAGPGAAFGGQIKVTIPPKFVVAHLTKGCTLTGSTVTCPFDNIRRYEGAVASILGRPMAPGPIQFNWSVTASVKQPSPDKVPNSGVVKGVVYPVPKVMIKKISPVLKIGKPGVISGSAASNVKKVQVGVLQVPSTPAVVCPWLGKNGKPQKVKPFAGRCDQGVWLDVKGTIDWKLNLKYGLEKGNYYVLARGTDTNGNTGTLFKMSDWSLDQFKVVKGK
jgi:hypothetical protein